MIRNWINAVVVVIFVVLAGLTPTRAQLNAPETWGGVGGGTANAQTVTIHNVVALPDLLGVPLRFLPGAANTAGVTLAVVLDSGGPLGPLSVLKQSPTGGLVALDASDLQTTQISVVMYDGTQFECVSCSQTRKAPTRQVFTSTGTYTRPTPAPLYLKVTMVGGGGGGGGSSTNGTGGTGGTGTSTSFSTFTANGGTAGTGSGSSQNGAGTGGTATGCAINIAGQSGNSTNNVANVGFGGSSPLFVGGAPVAAGTAAVGGLAGTATTGGGGSGALATTGPNGSGGGGGGGCIGWINAPASSISFTVGGGGGGGSAGTSGAAGGAGAGGIIIVEEFYNS